MDGSNEIMARRRLLAQLGAAGAGLVLAGPACGKSLALTGGNALSGLLGQASDSALTKLSQPGAFYADPAVRIGLPMLAGSGGIGGAIGGALGSVMGVGDKLGLTDGLVRKLNDAAGAAAAEAKPIFRSAISRIKLTDVPGLVQQGDGGTRYLQRSAGTDLGLKLRPLVDGAMNRLGAYGALDSLMKSSSLLGSAGISHDTLGQSVTDQALKGIFNYMAGEETRVRANPLGAAGSLLQGVLKKRN